MLLPRPDVVNDRLRTQILQTVPHSPATDAKKAKRSDLAEKCAAAKASGDEKSLAYHETRIDAIVYELFQLTTGEIRLVESAAS
ncbi:MAG: hypothetical protein JJU29_23510 [Verrucomicrobia bacterium]|nr:hypothetical protein [Verrucomicrobiota bacterium]